MRIFLKLPPPAPSRTGEGPPEKKSRLRQGKIRRSTLLRLEKRRRRRRRRNERHARRRVVHHHRRHRRRLGATPGIHRGLF
jgi:hypothetical protein